MRQLSLIEKAFFLKKNPLFNTLDLDLLVSIADKMNQDVYESNENVFEKDQKASKIYFIVSGHVVTMNEDEKVIKELKNEEFFGDEALFCDQPRAYSAICKCETLFLTLSKTHLMTIISECPIVAIVLLQLYSKTINCRFHEN